MTNFSMPCMRKFLSNGRLSPTKRAVREYAVQTADSLTAHFIGDTSASLALPQLYFTHSINIIPKGAVYVVERNDGL